MTTRPSLAMQRQSVEHLIALAERSGISASIVDAAKAATITLLYFERRQELTCKIAEVDAKAPWLAALLESFPGSTIKLTEEGL